MPIEINPGLCVAYQLTAALQTALSDGEGIMKCFQWNGHGSMRPCVGHCKCFQEGERHCRCLTCSPNTGGGEQEQTWCDCECKKKRSTISGIAANHVAQTPSTAFSCAQTIVSGSAAVLFWMIVASQPQKTQQANTLN